MPTEIAGSKIPETLGDDLDSVIELARTSGTIRKIILFGSYAYGTPGKHSDIDLCFITDDSRKKTEIMCELGTSLNGKTKHTLDILVYTPENFEYRANSISTIEKTIKKKGVVIYG